MACVITGVQIAGQNLDASGTPTSFELSFRVGQCEAVDVRVYDSSDTSEAPIYEGSSVPVSGPVDPAGLRLVILRLTPRPPKPCGGIYYVVIECSHNTACRFAQDVEVKCKEGLPTTPQPCSPTAILVVRNSAGTEVNLGQPCLAQDAYSIEIVSPWSASATAQWSVMPMPASGGSSTTVSIANASGQQLSYPVPDQLQPQGTGRTILVAILDTTPAGNPCLSQGAAPLPPVSPVACPTAIALELRLNNQPISPASTNPLTYTNLAAGFYDLRVTDPAGADVTFDWFTAAATPAQSGSSNSFGFDLSASNSPRTIEVFVRAGDCCPVLRNSATLSVTSAATPDREPPGAGTPGTPDREVPPPDDTTPPPGGLSLCGVVRVLAALALVLLFISVMFVVCPSPLTPVAASVAVAAAVAAAVLFALAFALCGMGFCGFWGIVIWSLRWAIVLGVLAAILLTVAIILFLPVLMCVLLVALGYGVVCGMLILWVTGRGCTIPRGFSWP
jgi:hypothetical protein